jgi:rod shape determining protein RodA
MREGVIRWFDYLVAAILLAIPVGLIAKQPDLGTALLVLAAGLYIIYFAGLSWRLIIPVVSLVGVAAVLLISFQTQLCAPGVDWPVLHGYQQHRVCTLLDPTSDPLGKGFHTIQSIIAIGSGGLTGKGWLQGTQTHLEFIPEKHTDFIFAVFSEEFGLLGNSVLLVLYALLVLRGFYIAAQAPSLFSRLLAGSITMIFFTYAFVNMGMVSGILPVVGVPLPLLSYGGTALVTLGMGIGILMNISRQKRFVQS